MNIHEYQAKKILSRYGVFVPRGKIAYTPNEAKNAAVHVSMRGPWMLKAQIQSGAREKGYFMEETILKGKKVVELKELAKNLGLGWGGDS